MNGIPIVLKSLFSSGLRVRILSHFFLHPGEEFHIRGLAAELGEPAGTVARELSNLERAGVVSSRRVGNQKHYGPRKDCAIIEDLRNIFIKTSGVGAQIRSALEKISGAELAFVFGSYASGEATASSDIDLMVVGNVSDRELAPVMAQVERRLKRDVNYTLYGRGEVGKRLGRKGDFITEVFSGPKIVLIGSEDDGLLRASR